MESHSKVVPEMKSALWYATDSYDDDDDGIFISDFFPRQTTVSPYPRGVSTDPGHEFCANFGTVEYIVCLFLLGRGCVCYEQSQPSGGPTASLSKKK